MIVERYANALYHYNPTVVCARWSIPNRGLLVGGSILTEADWRHLEKDFGAYAVVNCETEHDDIGKGIDRLIQMRVPDDGSPFPSKFIISVCAFASQYLHDNRIVHVHCQMGGSRSPAFAYAILRSFHKLNPTEALAEIRAGKEDPTYGNNHVHIAYMRSIDAVLTQ